MKDELRTDDGRKNKREFAKFLRKNTTPQEKIMWALLKEKQMYNLRFRRQSPIGPYIVDFVCLQRKIIIEIDGRYHEYKKEYDHSRDTFLQSIGYTVIRCSNFEVETDVQSVLQKIGRIIHSN